MERWLFCQSHVALYIDGSKMEQGLGAGIFGLKPRIEISVILSKEIEVRLGTRRQPFKASFKAARRSLQNLFSSSGRDLLRGLLSYCVPALLLCNLPNCCAHRNFE